MKKILLSFTLMMMTVLSYGQIQVVLDGTAADIDVTAGTTRYLNADTCYLLKGCFDVYGTIDIEPGTIIYGDKATGGSLIIHRGGKINAPGTANDPIIFTSAEPAGSRAAGDWGGIIIAGYAPSNQGVFLAEGPCRPIYAGSNNPDSCTDNSGVLTYVQIHFAGRNFGPVEGNEINSLTMAGVGSGTTIHHIQVTYANDDAFEWFGGSVNTKYLVAWKTRDDDFDTDFGYTGKNQFGVALRDPKIHDISKSNGFESDNNNNAGSGYAGNPQTRPIFVNYSLFGPLTCGNNPLHTNWGDGAHLRRNTALSTYNSLISGWGRGLFLADSFTINNTVNAGPSTFCSPAGPLNFSHNAFYNNTSDFAHNPAWTGCGTSMANWLSSGPGGCGETGVVGLGSGTGSAFGCNANYCRENLYKFGPDFRVTNATLLGMADWSHPDLSDPFFDNPVFAGAFGSTDWSDGWTNWCPQNYPEGCEDASSFRKNTQKEITVSNLSIMPNPASGTTQVLFALSEAAEVEIVIVDVKNGAVVKNVAKGNYAAGNNTATFDASDLQTGVYAVKIQTSKGVQTVQFVK